MSQLDPNATKIRIPHTFAPGCEIVGILHRTSDSKEGSAAPRKIALVGFHLSSSTARPRLFFLPDPSLDQLRFSMECLVTRTTSIRSCWRGLCLSTAFVSTSGSSSPSCRLSSSDQVLTSALPLDLDLISSSEATTKLQESGLWRPFLEMWTTFEWSPNI